MFARLLDLWLRFRARWRSRYEAMDDLEGKRFRDKHEYEWEIRKRDAEIDVLNHQVTFLTEALELERSVVAKLTAQFSVQQALAEIQPPGR